jgi:hypothetical protein
MTPQLRANRLAEARADYQAETDAHEGEAGAAGGTPAGPRSEELHEFELTALWLLGRVPQAVLPWPLLRPGRAGRGPGPDVREAAFLLPNGVVRSGDVEVHLRSSDWAHHGHDGDPAYDHVVLHLVWLQDRRAAGRDHFAPEGADPSPASVPTVAVGPALGFEPSRLRALLRRGPAGGEPCGAAAAARGAEATLALVRLEGRRRLAERAWRAAALAAEHGWEGAWRLLLEHALQRSAGRRPVPPAGMPGRASAPLDPTASPTNRAPVLMRLASLAPDRHALIEELRAYAGVGAGRASELGWNAALPLLIALAAAYDDVQLARHCARLAAEWPAPRPYGRTRALDALLTPEAAPPAAGRGMLWAQGLLRLQELWCERGGCGACPQSASVPLDPPRFALASEPEASLRLEATASRS